MTAKAKAKELVFDKFRLGINVSKYHLKHDPNNLYKAKQCALICVDEIIKEHETEVLETYDLSRQYFWEQVKSEINLL